MITADRPWIAGDPLYLARGCYTRRLIELIEQATDASWADAAQWPNPAPHHDLDHLIVVGRAS